MESEVERLVQVRTRELEAANAALRKSEQMLATEIDAAQRLQHVATQLMVAQGTEALHEQILDTALAILHADLASIQMVHPERGTTAELKLLGHRGFNAPGRSHLAGWPWPPPKRRGPKPPSGPPERHTPHDP
jgi:hypothetical protein